MSLLLHGARLIDGFSDDPSGLTDVWIDHGRIQAIGPKAAPSGEETPVLDCDGQFLLPGLIDCHVHLCFDSSPKPVNHLIADPDTTTLLKMAGNARRTLARGVTTVRDLGAPSFLDLALRDAIARGLVAGPRILASGPVITITGGHCHYMGHEADSLDEIRRAVRRNAKAGVDLVKVMSTGGRLTRGSSLDRAQYTQEELNVAVTEAAAAGLRVAMHTGGLEGIRRAVLAGADSVEHGSSMDEATMQLMIEKGTVWVPTGAPAVRVLSNSPGADYPAPYLDAVRATWETRRAAVRRGIELGVKFATGTDAGVPSTEHGDAALEVALFHELGMSPMEAIRTATRNAAELLGIEKEVGTLAVGKRADLVLLSGNPLADLSLLGRPAVVIQGGAVVHAAAWGVEGALA